MECRPLSCVYGDCVIPQRYVLCTMCFLAILIAYTNRVCLHIAMTEMVTPTPPKKGVDYCPADASSQITVQGGTFNWTEEQQGAILAAFFPGYVLSHLPGGIVADKFGAKHVISLGVLLSGFFTAMTPYAVIHGEWWMLAIMRFLVGLGQGPLYPCMANLLARWIPMRERSGLGAFVNTGNMIGSILGNLISSVIMAHEDWHMVFYFWGIIAAVWYIIFIILCHSDPSRHPFITLEEEDMLEDEIGLPQELDIPWNAILTDPVNWALLAGQAGHDCIFFFLVVELPKYLKDVLKFNVKENGVINSIPYLCLWVSSILSGIFADYAISRDLLSVLRMRQLYTAIAIVVPGGCLLAASFVGCDRTIASVMFALSMFGMGPFFAGMKVNVLDVTINFAGIVMALVNGMGALVFMPVPIMVANIAVDQTVEQWRTVIYIVVGVAVVLTLIYILFTSSEQAEWDEY